MIKRIQDTVNRIYATYLDINIRIIVYFVTLVMKNSSLQPACSKIKLNVIQFKVTKVMFDYYINITETSPNNLSREKSLFEQIFSH